tara:strand:- start:235 stop:393 length:159 start_codon:yes stop_codon:yes gene_type:complete
MTLAIGLSIGRLSARFIKIDFRPGNSCFNFHNQSADEPARVASDYYTTKHAV